jgi:hypothetical protein
MKIAFVSLLFAASAIAQSSSAVAPAACGPANVDFEVKLNYAVHTVEQPEAGKARIYFIHDAGTSAVFAYPTTKIGVDGAWVGAENSNSYFSVSVEPGEHRLCATLQSSLVDDQVDLAHLTAQAGKTYFFRTRLVMSGKVELLEFEPIESDQGKYLIAAFAQTAPTVAPAACGPANVVFKVKVDDASHTLAQPEPGKARVFFIQDDGPWGDHQHYTIKIGMDGAGVGAYKQNSWLSVSVEPGEHHVCANVQSNSTFGQLVALAHFTAEPGGVYYFRTRFPAGLPLPVQAEPYVFLDQVDSDQGEYLVSSYPLGVSKSSKRDAVRQSGPRDTR